MNGFQRHIEFHVTILSFYPKTLLELRVNMVICNFEHKSHLNPQYFIIGKSNYCRKINAD